MIAAGFLERIRRYDKNSKVIFDHEEPIGAATDLVMPRKRWFSRKTAAPGTLEARVEAQWNR